MLPTPASRLRSLKDVVYSGVFRTLLLRIASGVPHVLFKALQGVAPNRGAVFLFAGSYGAVRCDAVRILVFGNPTVWFGAVLSKGKSYGAVR